MNQPDNPADRERAENKTSDRNVLFVIMALRVGFIEPEQVISALHRWVDSKLRPIEQIMIESGFLTSQQHQILGPLVDAFVMQHRGSIEDSLAALTPIGEIKKRLEQLDDKDVSASLELIPTEDVKPPKQDPLADDPFPTEPFASQPQSLPRARFRILAFHKEGGLGRVSVAIDTELWRQVAFKEIKDPFADSDHYRDRFLLEAEITGRLEHPGIVPVYGLGHFPSGRPFYAMRFIQGDSFHSAIQAFHSREDLAVGQRRKEFRRLLERFLDVCDAVEYAHSRGVLHRDLKPGNIMLGRFGETLVVDWGLAKAQGSSPKSMKPDSPQAETVIEPRYGRGTTSSAGHAIGSPSFMSPEQAHGDLQSLGPHTDVFGLGATLYQLLTGRPPYESNQRDTALEMARCGKFPAPEEISPNTPTKLSEICLKAMATNISDRFQSVGEFREALWQWLADEPISALLAAVQHFEGLHSEQPDVPEFQVRLARELSNLSKVYQSLGRVGEAMRAAERSVDLLEKVNSAYPFQLPYFQELFFARTQLSLLLRESDQLELARKVDQANQEHFKRILQTAPKNEQFRRELLSMTLHQGHTVDQVEKMLEKFDASADGLDVPYPGEITETLHPGDVMPNSLREHPRSLDFGTRYEIVGTLAQGGAGVIYHALDRVIAREVVIKTATHGSEFLEKSFLREASVSSLLSHPHIRTVLDAGYQNDTGAPYMVMRLIDGKDLAEHRGTVRYSVVYKTPQWARWMKNYLSVCQAIAYAHRCGVVHGDIKLQNILIDQFDHAWLYDWGLCQIVDQSRFEDRFGSAINVLSDEVKDILLEKRELGQVAGTISYMSPEQASGEEYTYASDIYGLGACLYFLLTGQTAYSPHRSSESGGLAGMLQKIREGEFDSPRALDRRIPRKLEAVCLKAMSVQSSQRFVSAEELVSALQRVI